MRLYKILLQYFLFISFCYCHDLNHADPITIKQLESVVTGDPISKNGNETNDNNTNETNRYFTPIESKVSVIFSELNYFYIIF
jgi:hypothetical protein